MDTTITALASIFFGFIGVLGGSVLQIRMANAKFKLEIEEERHREKIKYLQGIIERLTESRSEYIFAMEENNVPSQRRYKSIIESVIYSIDDPRVQQLMQHEQSLPIEDVATDTIIRLGEMINEQMQISPVKTTRRWFWQ